MEGNNNMATLQTMVASPNNSHRSETATAAEDVVGNSNVMLMDGNDGDDDDNNNKDLLVDISLVDDEEHGWDTVGHSFLHHEIDDDDDSPSTADGKLKYRNTMLPTTYHHTSTESSLTPESVAEIVDGVLFSLQRARYERQQGAPSTSFLQRRITTSTSDSNTNHRDTPFLAKNHASPEGKEEELKMTLQTTSTEDTEDDTEAPSYSEGTSKYRDNTELRRRVQDFHRARFLRREQRRSSDPSLSYSGMNGLFQYLQDVQVDLEWAEDAAWRRTQNKEYLSWSDFTAIHGAVAQRTTTWFVYALVLVFTAVLIVSFHESNWEFVPLSVNPFVGPGPDVLLSLGALQRQAVLQDGEYYRVVTCLALHAGIIHYAINVVSVLFLGGIVEPYCGTLNTAIVFFVTAIGGNLASVLFMPEAHLSVGASGGILGLLGLYISLIVVNCGLLSLPASPDGSVPWFSAAFWFFVELIFNVMLGFTPYVDQFAHITSMFLGFGVCISFWQWFKVSGFFGPMPLPTLICCKLTRLMIFSFSMTILSLLAVWVVVLNNRSETENAQSLCHQCHYVSCVPFPFWKDEPWWQCDACDLATGHIETNVPTTVITLQCPPIAAGNTTPTRSLDLGEPNMDPVAIQKNMSHYCRQHCLA